MNKFSKEYFNDNCYFLIEGNGNDFVLSYSVYGTISESKKNEGKKKFDKKSYNKIKKVIDKHINSKNKSSKKEIETDLDSVELDEYVDSDGTFLTSKTPIYNMWTHPKKTMDQTINSTRNAGYSVTRGYRVYYGEGEEKDGNLIDEIDMSDAFGYDETKNKDFNTTLQIFKKMGVEDPKERLDRAKKFGKLPNQKVMKTKTGKKVLKQRLVEKEYLDEIKKQRMIKMVEDILAKKGGDHEIMEKDNEEGGLNKIITKNLEAIKNLAKKEGISINKLINILKKGE
jgi:hypothetical protein